MAVILLGFNENKPLAQNNLNFNYIFSLLVSDTCVLEFT